MVVKPCPFSGIGLTSERGGLTWQDRLQFPPPSGPGPGPCGICSEECPMSSQTPRRRRLEVEDIGEITVVNFIDRKILDEQNIQKIGEDLFSLVDELGRR